MEDAFLAHPAVAMCAVVGEPDPHSGEVPAVTLKPGMQLAGDAVLQDVAGKVYERPAVPKRVVVLGAAADGGRQGVSRRCGCGRRS